MSSCDKTHEITDVFGNRIGELVMEFDEPILKLERRDDRFFITLASVGIIDVTELLSEPKH